MAKYTYDTNSLEEAGLDFALGLSNAARAAADAEAEPITPQEYVAARMADVFGSYVQQKQQDEEKLVLEDLRSKSEQDRATVVDAARTARK